MKGRASQIGPESCVSGREVWDEALTGVLVGQVLSRERLLVRDADAVRVAEGNMAGRAIASALPVPRGRRPWHASETSCMGTGRSHGWPSAERTVRTGKAGGPKPVMHGHEKSDPSIVASRTNAEGTHRGKPANEGGGPSEEPVERREGAEGNAIGHGKRRTLSRESLSHGLDRVREAAKRNDQTVHRPAASYRRRTAEGGLWLAEESGVGGCGWGELGRLRRGS